MKTRIAHIMTGGNPLPLGLSLVSMLLITTTAGAQVRTENPQQVPLNIEVTISRHAGDEVVSRFPYTLSVVATEAPTHSSLRMGADVPVLNMAQTVGRDGEPIRNAPLAGPFEYRSVGTNIDCRVVKVGDRFQVEVSIEESSVYGEDETSVQDLKAAGVPVFRSYQSLNTLLLWDGQSTHYTTAADRVTGESVQVDVKLTVLE